ncbi:MAG: dihydrofolate reductase [Synechococcales cyanobacterium]
MTLKHTSPLQPSPLLIVIAALAGSRRVIGANGHLPWPPQPLDLQRFRRLTTGHALILGRKTWDIELHRQPLPERRMIVVSRQHQSWASQYPQVEWAGSLGEACALAQAEQQIFVGGGVSLFEEALPVADRWELTLFETAYDGDTFFPDYRPWLGSQFIQTAEEHHPGLRFCTFTRTRCHS